MYGKEENFIRGFGGGDLKARDHLKDLSFDGSIILKWVLKKIGTRTGLVFLRLGKSDVLL